jgi:hypothetical protein
LQGRAKRPYFPQKIILLVAVSDAKGRYTLDEKIDAYRPNRYCSRQYSGNVRQHNRAQIEKRCGTSGAGGPLQLYVNSAGRSSDPPYVRGDLKKAGTVAVIRIIEFSD